MSVSLANAKELSRCSITLPRFDSLVTDQFLPLLAIREIDTECAKRAVVATGNIPAVSFIPTGGIPNSSPVAFTDPAMDFVLKRIATIYEESGDISTNLGQFVSMLDVQTKLLVSAIRQKVGQEMWAITPSADAPRGMSDFALANPRGFINGGASPISLDLLGDLRDKISPWSPQSPLVYVMHTLTFKAVEKAARALGFEIDYHKDEMSGDVVPYFGSFKIACCDWISRTETAAPDTTSVYLVRAGDGKDAPEGIAGVALLALRGKRDVQVTAFVPKSDGTDMRQAEVYWDVAIDCGSRCSVARAANILST